jgi:hypothetical protein
MFKTKYIFRGFSMKHTKVFLIGMIGIMLALGTLVSMTGCEAMGSADNGSDKGWKQYNLLLEDVTEGVYYNATAYDSEDKPVGTTKTTTTSKGLKATGEKVTITLKPSTAPYFYPGGPYPLQLEGIATESDKSVKSANKITDTETRKISDFFFNEGDHSNTVKINWQEDSEFVSRTLTGSADVDAGEVSVSLNVNADYEYTLSVTIAYNDEDVVSDEVVSRGSVVPEWFDESAESDGSEWSEWTFEPDEEEDGIWTEPVTVYTDEFISEMRYIITDIAEQAATLQEALEEAEAAADAAVEVIANIQEALDKAAATAAAEDKAAAAATLKGAVAALKDAEGTLQDALDAVAEAAAEAKVTAALQGTMAALEDVGVALQKALEAVAEAQAKLLTAK